MDISANGWGRDMGTKSIVSMDLSALPRTEVSDTTVVMDHKKLHVAEDYICVSWGDRLQLTGKYMLQYTVRKDEILRMFKLVFGEKFSREELSHLGIVVDGAVPTNDELKKSIYNMRTIDLISIFTKPTEANSQRTDTHPQHDRLDRNLLRRIDELWESPRTVNGLKNINIEYVGDLVQKSEHELLRTPNFARKSVNEVKEVLTSMGLDLGMQIPNWPAT